MVGCEEASERAWTGVRLQYLDDLCVDCFCEDISCSQRRGCHCHDAARAFAAVLCAIACVECLNVRLHSYCPVVWRWPECYMYIQNDVMGGNVRGWNNGDPGPQGWFLTAALFSRDSSR
eukprot:1794049-Amphidinium_carterae.1